MKSLAPAFLVAVPQLQDPNFARTVTLLVEANQDGAFGLVLNRISPLTVEDLLKEQNLPCEREMFVRIGGPVQPDRAWVLHGRQRCAESSLAIRPDLWLSATWGALSELAQSNDAFHVFLGYAGWGPGQLERELSDGAWLLGDIDRDLVLSEAAGDDMWRTVIRSMGLDPGRIGSGGGVH